AAPDRARRDATDRPSVGATGLASAARPDQRSHPLSAAARGRWTRRVASDCRRLRLPGLGRSGWNFAGLAARLGCASDRLLRKVPIAATGLRPASARGLATAALGLLQGR